MTWAGSGQSAPASGTPKGFGFFRAVFEYIYNKYNAHVDNTTHADQHNASALLANEASYLLTTTRALTGNTLHTEQDMWRHEVANIWDGDFTAATWAARWSGGVPINLVTARNLLKRGLGAGDGLAVVGTDVPNVFGNSIPWRDASGYIPMVIGSIPHSAAQDLAVIATGTPSGSVIINAGSYIEAGTGILRFYGGGTIAGIAAPGAGLERFDAVYLAVNPAGAVLPSVLAGTAAATGTAGQPAIPDGACLLAYNYMSGTVNNISNQATVAGGFAPATASYIQDARHLRAGGTPPDAAFSMTKIKEFAPRPTTPPSLTVSVLGGGFFNAANAPLKYAGSAFTYNGAANVNLVGGVNPTLPAAGFARFDGLSVDTATGLLAVTVGVPSNGGGETEPALPLNSRPCGYVHVTATTTAIYANFAVMALATGGTTQGWIDDAYRMGAGGGGGGSSLSTITPAHVYANNDATYQDGFLGSSPVVTPNLPGLIQPSGNSVTIGGTLANPVKIGFNGVERRYPDPAAVSPPALATTAIGGGAATASGSLGYRYLVADISTAGVKTFAITIMATAPVGVATQAVLAPLWWDGTNLVTVPDLAPLVNIDSALINKRGTQIRWTGQLGLASTTLAVPPGSPVGTNAMPTSAPFVVPPNARVRFTLRTRGYYHAGATPAGATFFCWVLLDGVTQVLGTQTDSANFTADGNFRETVVDEVLSGPSTLTTPGSASVAVAPGQHTVTWGYVVGGTATFDATMVVIQVDVLHAGGN